jgi:glycosyltransferase involved in cell wall biosynthesis
MTTPLIIDGWNLQRSYVGLAIYSRRLIDGLVKAEGDLRLDVRVAVPADRVGAVCYADYASRLIPVRRPRCGHPLLDEAIWPWALDLHLRRRETAGRVLLPSMTWVHGLARRAIVVCHDLIPRRFPRYLGRSGLRRWLYRRSERAAAVCPAIVADSNSTRDDLLSLPGVHAGRIHVIHPWLPGNYRLAIARANSARVARRYSLPGNAPMLYIGGYDYRKNVELLVRAYAQASRRTGCPPLILAGHVPRPQHGLYCDVAGALSREGLGGNAAICCSGPIDPEDMPGLFGHARLLAFPSLHEGFGLPPLEAMGCGCPAVAANNSSLVEVVTDTDYRFAGDDADALASLLVRSAEGCLPLNPGFRRELFSEERAMASFADVLKGSP